MAVKSVNSISRGMKLLRLVGDGVNSVTDLATRLDLAKGTVHRLLKTLESENVVKQDPVKHTYYLGSLIPYLASKPLVLHQRLCAAAYAEMKRLMELTRETVILHIQVGMHRVCLEEIESEEDIKYTSGKGSFSPIYIGSASKILLAALDDSVLEPLLDKLQLEPVGPNTITDRKALLRELHTVRKQGYATSVGERIRGGAAISVLIDGYICPAALSVLGPEDRFKTRMVDFLADLQLSAKRISKRII